MLSSRANHFASVLLAHVKVSQDDFERAFRYYRAVVAKEVGYYDAADVLQDAILKAVSSHIKPTNSAAYLTTAIKWCVADFFKKGDNTRTDTISQVVHKVTTETGEEAQDVLFSLLQRALGGVDDVVERSITSRALPFVVGWRLAPHAAYANPRDASYIEHTLPLRDRKLLSLLRSASGPTTSGKASQADQEVLSQSRVRSVARDLGVSEGTLWPDVYQTYNRIRLSRRVLEEKASGRPLPPEEPREYWAKRADAHVDTEYSYRIAWLRWFYLRLGFARWRAILEELFLDVGTRRAPIGGNTDDSAKDALRELASWVTKGDFPKAETEYLLALIVVCTESEPHSADDAFVAAEEGLPSSRERWTFDKRMAWLLATNTNNIQQIRDRIRKRLAGDLSRAEPIRPIDLQPERLDAHQRTA